LRRFRKHRCEGARFHGLVLVRWLVHLALGLVLDLAVWLGLGLGLGFRDHAGLDRRQDRLLVVQRFAERAGFRRLVQQLQRLGHAAGQQRR
jgi:hypothetical protein